MNQSDNILPWSAGHRPGSLARFLKHAGTVPGAPLQPKFE
jgi:hypothetical protein